MNLSGRIADKPNRTGAIRENYKKVQKFAAPNLIVKNLVKNKSFGRLIPKRTKSFFNSFEG